VVLRRKRVTSKLYRYKERASWDLKQQEHISQKATKRGRDEKLTKSPAGEKMWVQRRIAERKGEDLDIRKKKKGSARPTRNLPGYHHAGKKGQQYSPWGLESNDH